jgi:hypothetical protein
MGNETLSRRRFLRLLGVILAGLGSGLAVITGNVQYLLMRIRLNSLSAIQPLPVLPPIIPRSEWGAVPPNHEAENEPGFAAEPTSPGWYVYPEPLAQHYNTVSIHHTALFRRENETMRSIQTVHMDQSRWADIGYHFGVDRQGQIYAGRDLEVRGASVAGHNTGVIGVVLMGHFEFEAPTDIQLATLQTLVNWLAGELQLTHLVGHYEFNDWTQCPGRFLIAYLDLLAQGAGLQRGTGGYTLPS